MTATILDVAPAMRILADHGVLDSVAIHTAMRVAALTDVDDDRERLALALAMRAPQRGHVAFDLDQVDAILDAEELAGLEPTQVDVLRDAFTAMVTHVRSVRDGRGSAASSPTLLGMAGPSDAMPSDGVVPPLVVAGDLVYTTRWFDLERRAIDALSTLRHPLPSDRAPAPGTV
ncbi:MAG TPA: hypothetical protein VJ978_08370, partial [Nitriliruptoraceae bacterium]|nr:hypothetical protein [Nitriliruptoraceae bacterium]